jgi:hypothetical protein
MATEGLPMQHIREILRLKWTLHRSHRDTARSLGMSPGAVDRGTLTWGGLNSPLRRVRGPIRSALPLGAYDVYKLGPYPRHPSRRLRITAQRRRRRRRLPRDGRQSEAGRHNVLPASVAAGEGRLARFQREGEVLVASLTHSNIPSIYALEQSGATTAVVME